MCSLATCGMWISNQKARNKTFLSLKNALNNTTQ